MQPLKHFIEWYFNISPAEAGEGTAWRWVFLHGNLFGSSLLIAGLLLAVLVAAVYRRDARSVRPRLRWTLIGLRLLEFTLLIGLLGGLTLSVTRTGLPFLPVLIDTSLSMGLTDDYSDPDLRQASAELLHGEAGADGSRLDLAKSVLLRNHAALLEELEQRYRVRLFEFSDTARPVSTAEIDGATAPAAIDAIRQLSASGLQTRPGPAVQNVLDSFRGTEPAAIVVLTDGIASSGDEDLLSRAAQSLHEPRVPLYPIAIGSADPTRDLELYDLYSETVAFLNDPLTFEFRVKAFGYANRKVTFELRLADSDDVLATAETVLGPDGHPVSVRMSYTPAEEGTYVFNINAPGLVGETNLENNRLQQTVRVRSEQIRVLLVERAPRWEYRHLKSVLERDSTVDLHTVLQESDLSFEQEDRTALDRFPATVEELFRYDVVIFGDVDLDYLNPGALENLAEFVSQRGGGMIFIAGERYDPSSYGGSPLEDLLPFDVDSVTLPTGPPTESFRLELTRAGAASPIFQLGARDPVETWGRLPGMYWWIAVARRKPGASVLAVHPTRHSDSGRFPIIMLQRVGSGQVLFHATDELWQLRRRREDTFYGRYWSQAVRFLARARLLSGNRGVEMASDRSVYRSGEPVRVRARFIDPGALPAPGEAVTAVVERQGGGKTEVPLNLHEAGSDVFEGLLRPPQPGHYHVWLATPASGDNPAACDFQVDIADEELSRRETAVRDLERAAELSGGQFFSITDVDELQDVLPSGDPVTLSRGRMIPLWDRWEVLLLFVGVLTAEWLLRKRGRLV